MARMQNEPSNNKSRILLMSKNNPCFKTYKENFLIHYQQKERQWPVYEITRVTWRVCVGNCVSFEIMVMVMYLYSAFSMWIYWNALYNTLRGTLPACFMAQFTMFFMQQVEFTGAPRTEWGMPDNKTGNFMPYFLRIVCGFFNVPHLYLRVVIRDLRLIVLNREDLKV